MRLTGAIVCLSLLIPNVGSPGKSNYPSRADSTNRWDTPALRPFSQKAYKHIISGQMLQAARVYEEGFREALRLGDKHSAVKFMNNVGGCRMGLLQPREAMEALILARTLADEIGFDLSARFSSLNLSQIYLQMGDINAAGQAANRGLNDLPKTTPPITHIQALLQMGLVRFHQKNTADSERLFRKAIALAESSNETQALGRAWNALGHTYLEQNRLQEAEEALRGSYRILSARNDPETDLCFPRLGRLYLRKGELDEASKWMDLAVRASASGSKVLPGWYVYYERGQLRQAQGKQGLALDDFRRALNAARLWRLEVVPAGAFRVSSEVRLQNIYDNFLSSGYKVYRSQPSDQLLRELFLASEENRAWSLRQTLRDDSTSKLPEEYFALLTEILAEDSRMLKEGALAQDEAKFANLRHRLTEMEAVACLRGASTLQVPNSERLAVRSIQTQLEDDEALLSFHLSGDTPLLWALTNDRLTMHPLPPQETIESAVSAFREAIDRQSPQLETVAVHAYQTLLGQLPQHVNAKRHWLLALDVGLFAVPFAALRQGNSYLVERHSLTLTPHTALRSSQKERTRGLSFLGFGDPVYNRADPRWKEPRHMFGDLRANHDAFELPRLPGSGREIERCGRLVDRNAVLIQGNDATAERLTTELRKQPSVIHFATHIVASKADPGQALVALSLKPDGASSLISRDSIAALRTNAALVVMSGCSSGLGPALPGAGLMGLTRAWLEAGAHSVAASLWPVPDDTGELLSTFYRALLDTNTSASTALQTAQVESLRSRSWRSNPRYWASYFIAGKD